MSTTHPPAGGPGNLGLALIAIDTAQHASHADRAIGENVAESSLGALAARRRDRTWLPAHGTPIPRPGSEGRSIGRYPEGALGG